MAGMRFVATLALLGSAGVAFAVGHHPPGLHVEDGVLLKDGRPFRGAGVNYFDAFYRNIVNAADTSYVQGFAELKARKIQVARFMAGGFWPIEWQLYLTNKPEYFRRFDEFVRAAERADIGLIPSLFWYMACVPDIVGEPCNRWGDPNSAVIAFMRTYTTEVVTRYKDSPAIWAWEFGNEYNLCVDLPNAAEWRPAVWPSLGTALFRTAEDDLYHDDIVNAFREFALAVRAVDGWRPVTTGNGLPRPSAQHLRDELSWTHDSRDEFKQNLADVTPDPMDLISIHTYPQLEDDRFNEGVVPLSEILALCQEVSAATGKALFIGEIGFRTDPPMGTPTETHAAFHNAMTTLETSGVPLAALWVYDRLDPSDLWNMSTTNDRAWMLDSLAATNHDIAPPPPPLPLTLTAPALIGAGLTAAGYRSLRRGG